MGMKSGLNHSDLNLMRRLKEQGRNNTEIARALLVRVEVIEAHLDPKPKAPAKKKAKKKAAKKVETTDGNED